MAVIGARVKDARKKAGLTQVELARRAGISRSYLAGAEAGRYNLSVKTMLSVAGVCHTDLNFLTGMTEMPVKQTEKPDKHGEDGS